MLRGVDQLLSFTIIGGSDLHSNRHPVEVAVILHPDAQVELLAMLQRNRGRYLLMFALVLTVVIALCWTTDRVAEKHLIHLNAFRGAVQLPIVRIGQIKGVETSHWGRENSGCIRGIIVKIRRHTVNLVTPIIARTARALVHGQVQLLVETKGQLNLVMLPLCTGFVVTVVPHLYPPTGRTHRSSGRQLKWPVDCGGRVARRERDVSRDRSLA